MQLFTGNSLYTDFFKDPLAITIAKSNSEDDTRMIQDAIDSIVAKMRYGIVFLTDNYIVSKTIKIYKGIRLIGIGKNRPSITLKANSFLDEKKHLIHFLADYHPDHEYDANPGTFYSALINVNLIAEDGNRNTRLIRSFFAQHSFIESVDFYINNAYCGIEQVGNIIHSCRFFGGQYGIDTEKPSPSWPFLMTDCLFENQKIAAFYTLECGLTAINLLIRNTPTGILVKKNHCEKLFIENSIWDNVTTAVKIAEDFNPRTQINLLNTSYQKVKTLLSGAKDYLIAEEKMNYIDEIHYGYHLTDSKKGITLTASEFSKKSPLLCAFPQIKGPFVNVLDLGIANDGTDITALLQDALCKYSSLYFPSGRYLVSDTLHLEKNQTLFGLNPTSTQIMLADDTPLFNAGVEMKPLIETNLEGFNIISGIGLDTGGKNVQSCALHFQCKEGSYINDVKFAGGHGTYNLYGEHVPVYDKNRLGDANPNRIWNSQFPSLLVNNGAGIFRNIWSASQYASAGIAIVNNSLPVYFYGISLEHHVKHELIVKNSQNVNFYDLQFEEERLESANCLPLLLENSSHLVFNNTYFYRVISQQKAFPMGCLVRNSKNIRFHGIHSYAPCKYKFCDTIFYEEWHQPIREREISLLQINKEPERKLHPFEIIKDQLQFPLGLFMRNEFLYFVEESTNTISRYSCKEKVFSTIDLPLIYPINIFVDELENIYLTTRKGAVFVISNFDVLTIKPLQKEPITTAESYVFPRNLWRDGYDFLDIVQEKYPFGYACLDKKHFIIDFIDLYRAYGLIAVTNNSPLAIADEFSQKTYLCLNKNGRLCDLKLITEHGEFDSLLFDKKIYILEGELLVVDLDGEIMERIILPERPHHLAIYDGSIYVTTASMLIKLNR